MDTLLSVPTIDERTRIPDAVIHELARRIAARFNPQRIILFGSYACGSPRPDSDVDLLVVMDTTLKESQQAVEIRQYLNVLFGMDLVVYRPAHLAQRLDWGDPFLREVLAKGIVLYETPDAGKSVQNNLGLGCWDDKLIRIKNN